MWGDKGAAPPRAASALPTPNGQKTMEEYIVNFRKIERFSDGRVRISPITSKSYNDKMIDRLWSDLKSFGYKRVGRSKDEHGNYYTTYELKALWLSSKDCEVISRITITKLK